MAPYRDAVPGRCVLDTHNVESVRARRTREATPFARRRHRWISLLEERKVARWERALSPRFDRVVTVSEGDASALRSLVPAARVAAVPMGVDLGYFRRAPADPASRGIVFAGSLFYGSNADAVRFFAARILPAVLREVPDARFTAVGHEPPPDIAALPGRLPQVAVTGSVPDVRPYLAGAAVVVCPLRSGGGVKSKILEGMAVGRPVVTTSVGAEGIEGARDGEHWIVRDDPDAFAGEVAALLRDPARREAMGDAARRLVQARYGWDRSLDALESVYREVVAGEWRR
jgi:glycosyltransferase involved in cell wall biosynthesis